MVKYQSYPRTYTQDNATKTSTGQPIVAAPTDILIFETKPKNVVNFGNGAISVNGVPYYGTIQAIVKNNEGTVIAGNTTYELLAVDANEVNYVVLKKGLLASLSETPITRNALNGLPMMQPGASEFATLRFRITPDAATATSNAGKTYDLTKCTFSISMTINNIVG